MIAMSPRANIESKPSARHLPPVSFVRTKEYSMNDETRLLNNLLSKGIERIQRGEPTVSVYLQCPIYLWGKLSESLHQARITQEFFTS
jgi:hypothetical protein